MVTLNLDVYNLYLIDVSEVFDSVSDEIVNDLYKYDLLSCSLQNKDNLNIFVHYFIKKIYELIDNNKKIVFVYNKEKIKRSSLCEVYDFETICNVFISVLKQLPVAFTEYTVSLKYFYKKIKERDDNALLLLNHIRNISNKTKVNLKPVTILSKNCYKWLSNNVFKEHFFIN